MPNGGTKTQSVFPKSDLVRPKTELVFHWRVARIDRSVIRKRPAPENEKKRRHGNKNTKKFGRTAGKLYFCIAFFGKYP